jgi:hypothetical protein
VLAVWQDRERQDALRILLVATMLVGLAGSGVAAASAQATAGKPRIAPRSAENTKQDEAALKEFQERLKKYLELRQRLAEKLKPLSPTASAAKLASEQESLAAALRNVRKDAKPGDLISPRVADHIQRTVAEYFRGKDAATKRAVFEEVPEGIRPVVNKTMPDNTALATVPPVLLNNLPLLPDNLQYRFAGRHIVLLDGDTRLMMDYILNALPPH